MIKRKQLRLLCFIIAIILLIVHFDAITSYAAPIEKKDSSKIISAIQTTEQGNTKKLYSNLTGKDTVYIRSFKITDLETPVTGRLLDDTATVVADNGITWEIPVIWVNKDGDIIKIAIEIDDIVRSYPIFVFYMPEGYSLIFGENATYDIGMPDFVAALMKKNGVTALSIPEAGRTYISTLLPNTTGFKINIVPTNTSEAGSTSDDGGKIVTTDPPDNPSGGGGGGSGPHVTPPTDNPTEPPDPGLSDDEKQQITDAHCDQNVISKIGVDKLAALIVWVKKTLEPEAANLLASKFPAYKNAASNDELGKGIGLYIYYDTYYEQDGSTTDNSNNLASVNGWFYSDGKYEYRVAVNARHFYTKDASGDWVFDSTTNYSVMDGTLVHEIMHAYMDDYTRTGMIGMQHDTTSTPETYTWNHDDLEFPKWFKEGMASSVDNLFQYRYNSIHYAYDYGYDADPTVNKFISDDLQQSYTNNSNIQITGDGEGSSYISGYLACVYLGYLAAQHNNIDAISGTRVDSSAILFGENYILEQLHNGKTLDDIIAEISTDSTGTPKYSKTTDFENGFIRDGGSSLEFCTTLLNYLQECSTDGNIANGSILLDFSDTNTAQLRLSLLNQNYNVYVPSDSKDYVESTVDRDKALTSGGESGPGTVGNSGNIQSTPSLDISGLATSQPDDMFDDVNERLATSQIDGIPDNEGDRLATQSSTLDNSALERDSQSIEAASSLESNENAPADNMPISNEPPQPSDNEPDVVGSETPKSDIELINVDSIADAISLAISSDKEDIVNHQNDVASTENSIKEDNSLNEEENNITHEEDVTASPIIENASDESTEYEPANEDSNNYDQINEPDSENDAENNDNSLENPKEVQNEEHITDVNNEETELEKSSNGTELETEATTDDSTDITPPSEIDDTNAGALQNDEVLEIAVAIEDNDTQEKNGLIISETDEHSGDNTSDDSNTEQVLDAIAEPSSEERQSNSSERLATQEQTG